MKVARRQFLGGVASTAVAASAVSAVVAKPASIPTRRKPTDAELSRMAEQLLVEYPENATLLGIDKGVHEPLRHRLTDRTPPGRARLAAGARARLAELRRMDLSDVGDLTVIGARAALIAHEIAVEGYGFPYGDVVNLDANLGYRNMPYVVSQFGGAFIETPDFLESRHTLETKEDAQAFVDRVAAYARNLDGETERLRHDRGIGVVAPDFIVDKTIAIIGGGAAEKPEQAQPFLTIAKAVEKNGIPKRYADEVRALVATRVLPSLAAQLAELKQHRAVAKHEAGVWRLPEGERYYRWALKAGTTTSMSPDEVHQLGLEQLRMTNDRMEAIMRRQGITGGTVGERMIALSKDPKQLFPNTPGGREQLLAYLNGRVADVRSRLPRAFATLVPGNLVIKRVPPAIEVGAPGGYASAGSIDGKVPGQYYINLRDTSEWPRYALPTLTYHEGIPGHVWQGEYANRLPLIRSLLAFNAYSEGWALYAEQLAAELGVYDNDPLGELGYLQSSSFRCCRLVVDTGIHAKRWTREQAVKWFFENNGEPIESIRAEVDRYCAAPGQACGYKIGQLEIDRLRDKARQALGAKYDLRQFNDAIVKGGNVPISLLPAVIDRFIASDGVA